MKRGRGGGAEEVTMRAFRAAPAKILRRASRTGTKLRVGEFLLSVEEADAPRGTSHLYGVMAGTGEIVGDPAGLLSAGDTWNADA